MESNSVARVLEDLEVTLRQSGLEPLVDQERASAAEGQVVETGRGKGAGSEGSQGLQVEALSDRERLGDLLDLLEAAVGGSHLIALRLGDFAVREFSAAVDEPAVAFSPSLDEGLLAPLGTESWTLASLVQVADREPAVRDVLQTVRHLRAALGLERSTVLAPRDDRGGSAQMELWS